MSSESKLDVLDMDSRLLKISCSVITPSLTSIFNKSLNKGTITEPWKTARISPIYKGKGPTDDLGNYRPISVLPHVSKIIEKCVHDQLMSYLKCNNIITEHQSAYLKYHSTQTSLHKVIDDVLDGINDNCCTELCFFDLSKCFDTIDHSRLLEKMHCYGIRDIELKWFSDYLSNRSQCVYVNGVISSIMQVAFGIPQGSTLGPLLFLLFTNDLPLCIQSSLCNLYADDTIIYATGTCPNDILPRLQTDVTNLVQWFTDNKLTVNINKSCVMNVGTKQKLRSLNDITTPVVINDTSLQNVNEVKYLGITLDQNLTWESHINELCKKVAPKIELLRRLKYKLPIDQLKTVYQSIVQPHIDYAITVWGYAANVHVQKIQRLQNRAARILTSNYDCFTSVSSLLEQLGLQSILERRDYFNALIVYKGLNGLAPNYITTKFTRIIDCHGISTRSALDGNLTVPKPNVECFKQSLCFTGAHTWNSLPIDVRESPSLYTFKRRYKAMHHT